MQRNFSKRLEMQIPQENTYARLEILPDFNKEFEKLSKDYTLRKPNELKEYLKQDEQLIPYINTLTPLIREYFPENESVKFYRLLSNFIFLHLKFHFDKNSF